MHPYLTRLGVRPEVQSFFRPFFYTDALGDLLFPYGKETEHFGFAFHRVPLTDNCWLAGNLHFSQVRLVILSASALDAISWLNKKYYSISNADSLLFLSLGAGISEPQIRWIREQFSEKHFQLIFTNDLLGRITDLKLAAAICNRQLSVYMGADEQVLVNFRATNFSFSQEAFGLPAFERAAGVRFGITALKPKIYNSFFDELKAGAGLLI